mgnify:CR=1 FL=1
MAQALVGLSLPSKMSGYLSFSALGEWLIAHIEITVLVVCFIGYQYFDYQRMQHATMVVQTPQQRDFFYVDYFVLDKTSDARHRYVPLKVLEIDQQNVTFKVGNIAHSTAVSPGEHMKFDKAMRRDFYRADTLTLSKDKIANLFNSGVIYDARRPRNIYVDGWVVMTLAELNSQ